MAQNNKLPNIPDISASKELRSREGAVYDSLRFSYDIDRDSALSYSEDGREIDFEFEDYPEYEFRNEEKSDNLDQSGLNRKLEIFEKYRSKNQQEEAHRNSDIVDSFDRIFNMKESKANEGSKYLFKKKHNNQEQPQPAIKASPIIGNTQSFILEKGGQSPQKGQVNEYIPTSVEKQELKTDTSMENLDTPKAKSQSNDNTFINELSLSNVSEISNGSSSNGFQLRQVPNFSNPFLLPNVDRQSEISSNSSIQVDDYPTKPETFPLPAREPVEARMAKGQPILIASPITSASRQNMGEESFNKMNLQRPTTSFNVEGFIGNNNRRDTTTNVYVVHPGMEPRPYFVPVGNTLAMGVPNQALEPSTRLASPIFEEENRIAPLFKKIRKMNSIYPNFNHPAINLENEAKFCNILATIFEEAFNFLEKMALKALDRAKEPKYFPQQFASLPFFLNSRWELERYREWEMLSSTLKPRTNFPKNDIDESKIKGALANYREVIVYYKEKKMELGSEESLKSYFRIRQKFWSLERNMRSISEDVYRIYQETEYPQFYYDYLNVLRAPLPAKTDEKTIRHNQQVLRVLIVNKQRSEPLSCSEVGQAVKVKLERELKFLYPTE